MRKPLFLLIGVITALLFSNTDIPASSLGFSPMLQEVPIGSSADVDLAIVNLGHGMPPSLGIFDLDITYDPTILAFSSVSFYDHLDILELGSITSFDDSTPGVVNLFELSIDDPVTLDTLQAGSFILATLEFDTMAVGTSPLGISINVLGDAWGDPLAVQPSSGSITVTPVPSTLLVLTIGLAGMGYRGMKQLFRS